MEEIYKGSTSGQAYGLSGNQCYADSVMSGMCVFVCVYLYVHAEGHKNRIVKIFSKWPSTKYKILEK